MGRINSKAKGKAGERELSRELAHIFGCDARRGQQYKGTPDSPDVITDITGVHVECKRCERLELYKAMEQAEEDRGPGEVPVVCHRRNNRPWLAIVPLDLLPMLVKSLSKYQGTMEGYRDVYADSGATG